VQTISVGAPDLVLHPTGGYHKCPHELFPFTGKTDETMKLLCFQVYTAMQAVLHSYTDNISLHSTVDHVRMSDVYAHIHREPGDSDSDQEYIIFETVSTLGAFSCSLTRLQLP
jgi:hypothetical protein